MPSLGCTNSHAAARCRKHPLRWQSSTQDSPAVANAASASLLIEYTSSTKTGITPMRNTLPDHQHKREELEHEDLHGGEKSVASAIANGELAILRREHALANRASRSRHTSAIRLSNHHLVLHMHIPTSPWLSRNTKKKRHDRLDRKWLDAE